MRRDGRGSSRESEYTMTRNRRRKAAIRAHQTATGTPYMLARRQLMSPGLDEVMAQHPLLGTFGIGVFDRGRKTLEQRRAELAVNRETLTGNETKVLQTVAWLRENVTPIKKPTFNSYWLKHVMERVAGVYVTNGEFIAAALIAGYPHRYAQPNMLFGMSARDIKRLER